MGAMKTFGWATMLVVLSGGNLYAQDAAPLPVAAPAPKSANAQAILPAGTPVIVMMNEEVSTRGNMVGNSFGVTVLQDVTMDGAVVVPKGTTGQGEVTFRTNKGAFGKPGIIAIALRNMDLGGKKVALDGRYREEGGNNNAAVFATWAAVGVFSAFIQGKAGLIPKGRELKARTGEDISFDPATAPRAIAAPTLPN